ncbi:MAG: adenine nucleotide alpha hydrolase family protein [Oscillospiraceae bacterium]|nr:adenine nucleotide alpha hydrolase family protein [Oscillospiraceae bacterium]
MDNKLLNDFTGTVRRAVDDYDMIREGDRVAVGVSGGKDSMLLLLALNHLKSFYPKHFELEAITIELGFEGMDFTPVREMCAEIGIPYTCLKTDIKEIVFDVRKEDNPCSLCAKMRRGALNDAIRERGIRKLALGHHFDDAVETYMMSLLFEGRISCFRPVTYLDRSGVTQIRPLIYAGEQKITNLAAALNVPVVENPCPQDKASKRYEIKQLLKTMCAEYPDMKSKIIGAMQRYPLPGWEPNENWHLKKNAEKEREA